MTRDNRRAMLDKLNSLNHMAFDEFGDPEIQAKIQQYELAYRMQTAVPEVTDVKSEPDYILQMYGPDALVPGTYAANCLLARKLSEAGVRFIQLYHQGWDQHGNLPNEMPLQAKDVDQPTAALIRDLKQRGLLEDTLVVWCTEFGRMPMFQKGAKGRDHNPNGFTAVLTGAGVKRGVSYGMTDELGFKAVENVSSVHDLNATILHLLGLDHERLTFRNNGIDRRLTDVHGHVIREILT